MLYSTEFGSVTVSTQYHRLVSRAITNLYFFVFVLLTTMLYFLRCSGMRAYPDFPDEL